MAMLHSHGRIVMIQNAQALCSQKDLYLHVMKINQQYMFKIQSEATITIGETALIEEQNFNIL